MAHSQPHPPLSPPNSPPTAPSFVAFGLRAEAEPIAPGLHVVATPIGNLRDITLRALATLAAADAIIAEDTRVSRNLLAHYGIATPLVAYHEHNAAAMRPLLIARLLKGEKLALISDAGTPLVSDPGFKLVGEALSANIPVTSAPGPSAVLAALVVAGLPTDRFFFEGFLPAKSGARRARIAELAAVPGTLVLFESPRRLTEALGREQNLPQFVWIKRRKPTLLQLFTLSHGASFRTPMPLTVLRADSAKGARSGTHGLPALFSLTPELRSTAR